MNSVLYPYRRGWHGTVNFTARGKKRRDSYLAKKHFGARHDLQSDVLSRRNYGQSTACAAIQCQRPCTLRYSTVWQPMAFALSRWYARTCEHRKPEGTASQKRIYADTSWATTRWQDRGNLREDGGDVIRGVELRAFYVCIGIALALVWFWRVKRVRVAVKRDTGEIFKIVEEAA